MEARHIPPPPPKPENSLEGRKSLVAHHNPSDGILLLGHASLLTAMALTQDENYIITADRDEHIRVSHYPDGHSIERFCLGHTKCVRTSQFGTAELPVRGLSYHLALT